MNPEETLVRIQAYLFESSLDLRSMCERLNTHRSFRWAIGDSDTFGDYLITRPFRDCTKLRIVEEEGGFIFDIVFRSEAAKTLPDFGLSCGRPNHVKVRHSGHDLLQYTNFCKTL